MLSVIKTNHTSSVSSIFTHGVLCLTLSLILTLSAFAQSSVRFLLDTSNYPIEQGDKVMICGSGVTFGEWESRDFLMAPSLEVPGQYEIEVPFTQQEIGTTVSYKFVVIKPGNVQYWEEVANRKVVIPASGITLDPAPFENRTQPGTTQLIMPVTIAIDLSRWEGFNEQIDAIGIKSTLHPLPLTVRVESDPLPLTDDDGDGIWTTRFNVLYGSPREFSFSLYYLQEDVWSLHMLYGKQEHAALLPEKAEDVIISLAFSPENGGYVSTSPAELYVNDYPGIYQALGEWAKGTRFQYFAVMQLLKEGQFQRARQAYQQYARDRNTDWDVRDDFDYMWIQQLAENQGVAQAEAYARQAGKDKYEYLRRSYLAKVAEAAYMVGDTKRTKALSRELHDNPQFKGQLTWNEYFSRQILAMSYIADRHEDSTAVAMQLFEQAADDSTDAYWRRNAMWQQVYAHTDAKNPEAALRVYERLAKTGLPGQRMAARHRQAEFYLRQGDAEMAQATLDRAEAELAVQPDSPSRQAWWLRQQLKRARFHEEVGDTTRAVLTLQTAREQATPGQRRQLNKAVEQVRQREENRRKSRATNRGGNQ